MGAGCCKRIIQAFTAGRSYRGMASLSKCAQLFNLWQSEAERGVVGGVAAYFNPS